MYDCKFIMDIITRYCLIEQVCSELSLIRQGYKDEILLRYNNGFEEKNYAYGE